MSIRKTGTILLLTALLLSILSGCGSKSYDAGSPMENYEYADAVAETMAASRDFALAVTAEESGSGAENTADVLPENRKWVITMNIDTETEDLDGALDSLNRQIREQGLTRPQHVYTVTLSDKKKEITADNGKEVLEYEWKSVHHAYRNLTATYLYLTPQRALLLPHSCLEDPDKLWALLTKKLPKEKCTVL